MNRSIKTASSIVVLFYLLLDITIGYAQESCKDISKDNINSKFNQSSNKYTINLTPSALIKSPKEGASAILVEKDSQTLWVYTSKNGEYMKAMEIPCSTGEVDGPKQIEGDKKTPEGIYFLKKTYKERFLTPIYGKRAFTTDYPNLFDIRAGRTGSAIWLHGTNKILKPMDSNGCVAMNNDDVVKLDSYIILNDTPVIISDKIDYVQPQTLMIQQFEIIKFLSQWLNALNKGSYLDYLFYYASDYIPDVRWWSEWIDIRNRTYLSNNPVAANFDNVGIYKYKDYFVVIFDFKVSSLYKTIYVGKRKFFIKHNIVDKSYSYGSDNAAVVKKSEISNKDSSLYYYDDYYKIIGDIFQNSITKGDSEKKNAFIYSAEKLDKQRD